MKQIVLAAMIVLSSSTSALAGNEAQAMKLYEQGEAFYNKGKYAEALKAFQKAYKLEPAPLLYVNIGQCHRQLGNHEAAVAAFERYLSEEPEGEMKAQVEEILAEERRILNPPVPELETTPEPEPTPPPAPEPAATPPPPPPQAAPAEDGGLLASPGLWIAVGGTALVLAAGGAVVAVVASQPPPPPPVGSLGTFDLR